MSTGSKQLDLIHATYHLNLNKKYFIKKIVKSNFKKKLSLLERNNTFGCIFRVLDWASDLGFFEKKKKIWSPFYFQALARLTKELGGEKKKKCVRAHNNFPMWSPTAIALVPCGRI